MSATVEIVRTPDVLHGKPRIEGTRIGPHHVGGLADRGLSVAEICEEYPTLDRAQVEVALDYYESHPDEMATLRAQAEAARIRIQEQSRAPE